MGLFSKLREAKIVDREKEPYVKELLDKDGCLAKARFVVQAHAHSGFATDSVMRCKLYESEDDCNRAGVILELTIDTATSAVLPYAELTDNGLDLHIGGAEEHKALVRVIVRALLRSSLRNIVLREAAMALVDSITAHRDEQDYEP